ncbi:MAG: hypothetical protein KDF63_06005 [Rhodoferax sp.]|jgi:hypothetical protein|nr:hypothetical protein [Rhodoferax sp.]
MFGSIDKSEGLLFVTHEFDRANRATVQSMQKEVEGLDENQLPCSSGGPATRRNLLDGFRVDWDPLAVHSMAVRRKQCQALTRVEACPRRTNTEGI